MIQINQKMKYIAMVMALVVAFIAGYKSHKPEEVTHIEERIVEVQIDKETGEKSTDQKNNKIKVVTKKPDGSTEIVEIDKGTKNTSEKTEKESVKSKDASKTETRIVSKSKYRAGISITGKELDVSKNKLGFKPIYGINGGVRLFGDIWAEMNISTEKRIGLGVSYEW